MILYVSTASAQTTLKYDATIGPDGKVQVAPSDERPKTMAEVLQGGNLYILKNPDGAVKAIYSSRDAAVDQLTPGDTVEALATAGTDGGAAEITTSIESSQVRQAAEKVAQDLLEQARSVMCSMEVRPTSFTTGAEVSFHLFAGTTLQVSATWESEAVCK